MNEKHRLIVGTNNAKKGRELVELLAPHGFEVLTLAEIGADLVVDEDGDTFAANARKKAGELAARLGQWVLADDSGLEVDALDGRPGVYSARYAGPTATDADNNRRLLEELAGVPAERRTANYYCHVAVADPTGGVRGESSGICRGRILTELHGEHGFGYDPMFEVVEHHQTFGQLGPAVKRAISHRARAIRAIVPQLVALARQGEWTPRDVVRK
jgi:XTP/dITP diphosphohydrolase